MNFLYLNKKFEAIKHWHKVNKNESKRELNNLCQNNSLFFYFFNKVQDLTKDLPKRNDGTDSFMHPCNVVKLLKNAKINEEISLCAGIAHDYIEESVDLYAKRNNIQADKKGKKILDNYAIKITHKLKQEALTKFSKSKKDIDKINKIISILILLTRYKRHHYYDSLSEMFKFKEHKIKELAIQVKLADRLHNILCLQGYPKHDRIYQCFKNLFILNNTKEYLIYNKEDIDNGNSPTIKLFKKCAKATYDALLSIEYNMSKNKRVFEAAAMLQLAFKKYSLEKKGLEKVTKINLKEKHPIRLYEGIIRKYDSWLHQNKNNFIKAQNSERIYCKNFFKELKLTEKEIDLIIAYKDAYALKEVIGYLIYDYKYTIKGFTTKKLFL
jgi:hypothetical protein